MLRKIILSLLLCGTQLFALPAPDVFMENLTQGVMHDLKQMGEMKQQEEMLSMVQTKILPSVDVDYMAMWVIGRTAWNQSSLEERQAFSERFTVLLTKTYSSTLFLFRDKRIKYQPVAQNYLNMKRTQVFCEILQPGKPQLNVTYQLQRYGDTWKIFDVLIEGVSMLKGLQAQFSDTVAKSGLTGALVLIDHKIKDKNPTHEK